MPAGASTRVVTSPSVGVYAPGKMRRRIHGVERARRVASDEVEQAAAAVAPQGRVEERRRELWKCGRPTCSSMPTETNASNVPATLR